MARRKEKTKPHPAPYQSVDASLTPAQDFFRRVLLGLITALIVARPLVPTEDPGLRAAMPDPSGPTLSWLWFVAFFGWTLWRFWAKPQGVRFDLLDGALLALVGVNLLSALAARYRYVAWLGAWEWLTFFIAFYMVRRLVAWPGTSDGLLAALLATAVMLSGYSAYQRYVEIPEQAKKSRAELQADMAAESFAHGRDTHYWDELEQRARAANVFATFAHPNSFAGFLVLLLPAALVYAVTLRRTGGWDALTVLAIFLAALIATALWWTHSRGALLAALIVAGAVILQALRRMLSLRRVQLAAGLLVPAIALAVLGYVGMHEKTVGKAAPGESASLRLGYWKATWKMIREQPLLGVGPGNFGRHYPAYMAPTDHEDIQNPHNLLLEMWAGCGFLGIVLLVLAFALCFRRVRSFLRAERVPLPETGIQIGHGRLPLRPPDVNSGQGQGQRIGGRTPWEFYLGGMSGLILGFALMFSTSDLVFPPNTSASDRIFMFLYRYHASLLRSIIWFPAFALFLSVRLTDSIRVKALIAGLAVLCLNLCVSDGISIPAVALPLWICTALVMATCDARTVRSHPRLEQAGQFGLLLGVLPILISGLFVLIYCLTYWEPTIQGARLVRRAMTAGGEYAQTIYAQPDALAIPENRAREIRTKPITFITQHILGPLKKAAEANPDDMRYVLQQADWYRVIWQHSRGGGRRDAVQLEALDLMAKVLINDPLNRENWLAQARLELIIAETLQLDSWYATQAVSWPWGPFFNLQLPPQPIEAVVRILNLRAAKAAQTAWSDRANALAEAVKLGPTQLLVRYDLVVAYRFAGQEKSAKDQARELLRLDRAVHRSRRLPIAQHKQVQQWLEPPKGQ
jgi:hypothetical protein